MLLLQTETLLKMIGQDHQVAKYAHEYVLLQLPVILLASFNDAQKRFLNCCKKNFVPMASNLVNTLMYPLWCYLFIIHLELGIQGCALADLISMSITLVINFVYTYCCHDLQESIMWPDLRLFTNFKEQLSLGTFSAITSIIEGLSIQILMIMSGYLSVEEQAANTIIMNIVMVFQSIGVGLMTSSTTLVG